MMRSQTLATCARPSVSISLRAPARRSLPVTTASRSAPFVCRAAAADAATDNVIEILTSDQFDAVLEGAGDSLVVMDVGSSKCGPCKLVYPFFVQMSEKHEDSAVFIKIQGDASSETVALMKEWGVKAVPEFRFYKSGELIHKHNGADKEKLQGHIEEFL